MNSFLLDDLMSWCVSPATRLLMTRNRGRMAQQINFDWATSDCRTPPSNLLPARFVYSVSFSSKTSIIQSLYTLFHFKFFPTIYPCGNQ